jgi:hypothetical protein
MANLTRCTFVVCALSIASAFSSCEISVREIPINTTLLSISALSGETCTFSLVDTKLQHHTVVGVGSGLVIPLHAVEQTGLLQLTIFNDSASRKFVVAVFEAPVFSHVNPVNFSTLSHIPATLYLAPSSAPVPGLSSDTATVRVVCGAIGIRTLDAILSAVEDHSMWYAVIAQIAPDARSLSFTTEVRLKLSCTHALNAHIRFHTSSHPRPILVPSLCRWILSPVRLWISWYHSTAASIGIWVSVECLCTTPRQSRWSPCFKRRLLGSHGQKRTTSLASAWRLISAQQWMRLSIMRIRINLQTLSAPEKI